MSAYDHTKPPEAITRHAGPAWHVVGAVALLVVALTALWRYTPLAGYVTAERVTAWAGAMGEMPWAPFAFVLAYTPAAFILFPRPLITLAAVIALGPRTGFTCAMTGILLAAVVSFVLGRRMSCERVRRLVGHKLDAMSAVLRRRGLVAVLAVRIVPVAPFAVIGVVAGAWRIRIADYVLGTALGLLPGTLTTTVFGDQLQAALHDPSRINYWLVAAVVALFLSVTVLMRRWFVRQQAAQLAQS